MNLMQCAFFVAFKNFGKHLIDLFFDILDIVYSKFGNEGLVFIIGNFLENFFCQAQAAGGDKVLSQFEKDLGINSLRIE